MSREKEIAAYCRRLPKAELRPSCEVLVRECVDQSEKKAKHFVLVGPRGQKRTLKDVASCLKEGLRLPTLFGPLPASRFTSKGRIDPAAEHARCDELGGKESAKGATCRRIVDFCAAQPDAPMQLPTTEGPFTPSDRKECLLLAPTLARIGFQLAETPSRSPDSAPKPPSPDGSGEDAAPAPASQEGAASAPASQRVKEDELVPNDRPKILKPFSEMRLRLQVTKGEPREVRRILMLGNGKGIPIRLRYSVRPIEGQHRYHLTYTIFRGKEKLSEERSMEFSADGGKINLAFELDPWKEGDLSSFRSIRIVTMK